MEVENKRGEEKETNCTAATAPGMFFILISYLVRIQHRVRRVPYLPFSDLFLVGVVFANAQERLQHYKSEWHLWNLKLRANGIKPLNKEAFEQLQKAGGTLTSRPTNSKTDEREFTLELLNSDVTEENQDTSSEDEKEKEEEGHTVFGKKGSAKIDFLTEDHLKVAIIPLRLLMHSDFGLESHAHTKPERALHFPYSVFGFSERNTQEDEGCCILGLWWPVCWWILR